MSFLSFAQAFAALLFVLGLIGLAGWAYRRYGGQFGAAVRPTAQTRRLKVVESTNIDGRHRLVLVARDDVEHLLVVGLDTSILVENGITAKGAAGHGDKS